MRPNNQSSWRDMGSESMTHDQIMQYSNEVCEIFGVEVRDIANAHGQRALEDKFQSLFVTAVNLEIAMLQEQPQGPNNGEVVTPFRTHTSKIHEKLGKFASGFAEGFMFSPISVFAPKVQLPRTKR